MPPNASLYEQVYLEIARFIGWWGWIISRKKKVAEVHPTGSEAKSYARAQREYAKIVNDAYDLIDELRTTCEQQRAQLQIITMERDKQIVEIELLEDEINWLTIVLKAGVTCPSCEEKIKIKLSDYDHLHQLRRQ